jgi:hypothetical protein
MMEVPRWKRILIAIWPTIYRGINNTVYFFVMLTKKTVKMAIEQMKGQ